MLRKLAVVAALIAALAVPVAVEQRFSANRQCAVIDARIPDVLAVELCGHVDFVGFLPVNAADPAWMEIDLKDPLGLAVAMRRLDAEQALKDWL